MILFEFTEPYGLGLGVDDHHRAVLLRDSRNNDGEVEGLESGFESIEGELHGRFAELEFGGKRFAALHGESLEEVEGHAESGEYDYVLYGHHHEHERREVGDTVVVNPGAHFPTVPEEHRTVAIVDTEADEVRFLEL